MKDKRYHVYISTSFDDVKMERLKLENTLLNLSVFPWEFKEPRTSLNTAQARRQIDDCDYVIFIISSRYGDLSASGISYMHLDFLYALNKEKTIISLIDGDSGRKPIENQETNSEMQKKLETFRELLRKESHYCSEFCSLLDLEKVARLQFAKAVKDSPALGWVRPKNTDTLQQEIQRLRQKVSELEQNLVQAHYEIQANEHQPNNPEQNKKTAIISYRTHAYQDGNLKDLHPQREVTWVELLKILAPHFQSPVLENTFVKAINDYLEQTALEDARAVLPRAHAVARTQIDTRCLQQIKMQMKWNNWIIPQPTTSSATRIYWKITPEAERLLSI